jgi:hypothetical protein
MVCSTRLADLSLQQLDFSCTLCAKLNQALVISELALEGHKLACKRFEQLRSATEHFA